jgi:hypothetical protein
MNVDVLFISFFASLGCIGSIAEQIRYAAFWKIIKEAEYQAKENDLKDVVLVVTGGVQGADYGLFWLRE